jgi:hypothetical protein
VASIDYKIYSEEEHTTTGFILAQGTRQVV